MQHTIKKGKRNGLERRRCLDCNRWFSINRIPKKGCSVATLVNLHLAGIPYRKLSAIYGSSPPTLMRRVYEYLDDLPANADITREYSVKYSGVLVLDGKYINIKGYNKGMVLLWGVDYLTHDVPHFKLVPSENYFASISYFKSLRLLNYPLKYLVSDDNPSFKMAALNVYPKTVYQTCTNHFKEGIRKTLKVRSDSTYKQFVFDLEKLFERKLTVLEFDRLAGKLYQKWKDDPITQDIILNIEKRKEDLLAYTHVHGAPYTTNLIEGYNSHLEGRLKSIKCFEDQSHAKSWLNAYILKRRLTPFTDCQGRFKKLNGKCSLELTLRDNDNLPNLF